MDFAQDTPFRFGPRRLVEVLGIEVDNLLDISTNKLSALYDRSEPKDFVDVYVIHREVLPFPELVDKARQKHVGLDPYWLAQACARIREVGLLPRLVKPVTLEELRAFFEDQARRLMGQHSADRAALPRREARGAAPAHHRPKAIRSEIA